MSEWLFNLGVAVIVIAALGFLIWLSWPSKTNFDQLEDEHAKDPFRW